MTWRGMGGVLLAIGLVFYQEAPSLFNKLPIPPKIKNNIVKFTGVFLCAIGLVFGVISII